MNTFNSLKKAPLVQEVESQIKESIIAGKFKIGDKLPPERDLVDQFQVSRTTIREALHSIQNLGLISIKRGAQAGAYISNPDAKPITQSFQNLFALGKLTSSQLMDARLLIEPELAKYAANHCKKEDIKRLEELLNRAKYFANTSCKEARMINVRFHHEIAKITKNPIMIFLSESITQVFLAVIIELTQKEINEDIVLELISEHYDILSVIKKGAADEASNATHDHLLKTRDRYSHIFYSNQKDLELSTKPSETNRTDMLDL